MGSSKLTVPEPIERLHAWIEARDQADQGRAVAPLRKPEGALVLDTTRLGFEEQVERIVDAVHDLP